MTRPLADLSHQTSKYQDICWNDFGEQSPPPTRTVTMDDQAPDLATPPPGVKNGMAPSDPTPPYWLYDVSLNASDGLKLTNVRVVNAGGTGVAEKVFEEIAFADLQYECDDGLGLTLFNLGKAFNSQESVLQIGSRGEEFQSNDDLYQGGWRLVLVDEVAGKCRLTCELSIVFRGSKNDFDPGGIPVALIAWPQITWRWEGFADGSPPAKRVTRFRGSVKVTVCNYMHHAHGGNPIVDANVASFFADSNGLPSELNRPIGWIQNLGSALTFNPIGWSKLFDYVKLHVQEEVEFVAVHGPRDGDKFTAPSTARRRNSYVWPAGASTRIVVDKVDGQGRYDNLHLHGKMEPLVSGVEDQADVEIHAPFCGHSCIHTHWRWGVISALSFNGLKVGSGSFGIPLFVPTFEFRSKYLGWSRAESPKSNTGLGAPLTPPNQRVTIALCREGATRFSEDFIIDPGAPQTLDKLKKLFYYQTDVFDPEAGCQQVIWPQGIGWAFRYTLPVESFTIRLLGVNFLDLNVASGTATASDVADFFANKVYPGVRYIGGNKANGNQVPDGSHAVTDPPTSAATPMEDL